MVNLNTPFTVPIDFNGITSTLIHSKDSIVFTTYHLNDNERKEVVERINKFPKLVREAQKIIDAVEADLPLDKNDIFELKKLLNNYPKKRQNDYK